MTPTPESIRAALEKIDPNLRAIYDSLNVDERKWLLRCIEESATTGKSLSLDYLTQVDYEREPVSIYQFLSDEYYLGGLDVWPRWKKEVEYVCDPTHEINEVILGGGIGLGKTYIAMVMMLYKLYELSCLRFPAQYHGLAKNSPMIFGVYNATLKLTDVGMDTLLGQLDMSPYFRENFWYKDVYSDLVFPKNVKLITGSQAFHTLGSNLYCLAIDEMNFHAETKRQSKAKTMQEKGKIHELVTQTSRRMESRFKMHGRGGGLIIHISSTKTAHSYLEIRKREVKGNPGVHIVEGPQWEFHRSDKYGGKKFRFVIGNKMVKPACLDKVIYHGHDSYEVQLGGSSPRGLRVLEVPVEDYIAFHDDPIGSMRDIAGIATDTIDPFFPRSQPVMDAINPTVTNPFPDGMGTTWGNPLIVDLNSPTRIQDYIIREEFLTVRASRELPKRHPHAPRYIHCDLARNGDALGLAMVHPTRAVAKMIQEENGEVSRKLELFLEVDFAVQIMPDTSEVDWEKIRDFILWLRDHGFNIQEVSYDSPASGGEIQYLKKVGVNARYLSVDRKPLRLGKKAPQNPYHVFKTMLNEGRVSWAPNEVLQDELLGLENMEDGMIDHSVGSSKDVSDSACGAVFLILQDDKVGTLLTTVESDSLTHQDKVLDQVRVMMAHRAAHGMQETDGG